MQAIKIKQNGQSSFFSSSNDNFVNFHSSVTKKLKTCKINNKRYLGNKYKLLNFIRGIVEQECNNIDTVADIFAGTGAVASAFTDKILITNDILYSNYICHLAWFGKQKYSQSKIEKLLVYYNNVNSFSTNYMSDTFSDTFFSHENCKKIGFIREDIEKQFNAKKINERERAILITSLLYSIDKIANTCGHYDAYRKNGELNKNFELLIPQPDINLKNNQIFNMDANELVKNIEADLVYIDPPYNSRQYCDAYHLLENVATWKKPEVSGVARKMDRTKLKSEYCTSNATKAFEELVSNIKAKYILLSYNNMENKGNSRSNAKISDEDILKILRSKGDVKIFSQKYKSFTTGKSDIQNNEERLFLCVCKKEKKDILIQSPMNYLGGKYKLLKQILPFFPKNINNFLDLFAGGGNVGINVSAQNIVLNDFDKNLYGIYSTFRTIKKEELLDKIQTIIKNFSLSESSKYGYDYYDCESGVGLQKYNKDGFNLLKKHFNSLTKKDKDYYILLYVLIIYSFNNQFRFNNKGEFNLPVGKRDFNSKMVMKLSLFIDKIQSSNISFTNFDFRNYPLEKITNDTFVYVDPPYLITCATYNEKNGWQEKDEIDLLNYLSKLDGKGIKFALSNVLSSKGKKNSILINWIKEHNFKVIHLDYSYGNSNYHTKDKTSKPEEVLIINY